MVGRLGCWSLLLEMCVSVLGVSLNCLFMERQEARTHSELAGCAAWPGLHGAWDEVIGGKTAPVQGDKVLPLTLPLRCPEELSLLLAPVPQGVSGLRGQQLLVGTGEIKGGDCEVDHQTHIPCLDGMMGLSPEQSSPSHAPPTNSSNHSAPCAPWVGNSDGSGSRSSAQAEEKLR